MLPARCVCHMKPALLNEIILNGHKSDLLTLVKSYTTLLVQKYKGYQNIFSCPKHTFSAASPIVIRLNSQCGGNS